MEYLEGDNNKEKVHRDQIKLIGNFNSSYLLGNNSNSRSNNHYVVPVGVIFVLFTFYLTTAALHKNYRMDDELQQKRDMEQLELAREIEFRRLHEAAEIQRRTMILERFLEYENVCKDFEIFKKDIKSMDTFDGGEIELENKNTDYNINDDNNDYDDGDVKDVKAIDKPKKLKQHLINRKHSNGGHKHSNKSSKIKFINNNKINNKVKHMKKDTQQQTKKSSTAEPIIYLFALVFIYLLLKAASDINQHYKSQNKGDKRLRRCSLQSYAQTHKQDRRASKGIATKNLPKF